ncbi:hypothetical protein [Vulgatibacter incomptus]|uniref:Uncharacterized protein n=1 Tax=Vulgatibacter incomptus TaxID=1391653 RepID=A0A0K1PDI5_9BACT|nr:hypothetical protein [Vulgatibacter incomptus]AKU91603.1 hypothetical protein AKJ08_1990 [Vulgatibacter incomptus]
MQQSLSTPSSAASQAFRALVGAASAGSDPGSDPGTAFAQALILAAPPAPRRPRTRRTIQVGAGSPTEVLQVESAGSPSVEPAPGSLAGFDEGVAGVSLYRVARSGRVGDRSIASGALLLVGARPAERGEWVLVATTCSLRLVPAFAKDREPLGSRVVGVVEAVVASLGNLQ